MAVSTVSVKGQITLPASLRRQLGIKPHDRVLIELAEDAIVVKTALDLFEYEGFLGRGLPTAKE